MDAFGNLYFRKIFAMETPLSAKNLTSPIAKPNKRSSSGTH